MSQAIRKIKKMKWNILFSIFASFFIVFIVLYFLTRHLYSIQIPERLRYVKDYQEFVLTLDVIPDCQNQIIPIFQKDDVVYLGKCVREVYVNYGKTKAPLQMVLNEEYINLTDIRKKLNKKETFTIKPEFENEIGKKYDEMVYYEYRRSDKKEGNYLVTIVDKNYQTGKLTEVTFEPYLD